MMSGVLPEKLRSIPEPWQRLIRECLVVDATKRLAHAEDCLEILDGGVVDKPLVDETQLEEVVAKQPEVKPHSDEKTPLPPVQKPPLPPEQKPKSDAESKPNPKRKMWWLWLLLLATIIGGLMWIVGDGLFNTTTSGRYKVGDYYNENGKQGVVFEVWNNGLHGKIVSLDETQAVWDTRVTWDWDTEDGFGNGTRTYADNRSDGKANTDKIMSRSDSKYFEAFVWCRAKGGSWYLPSLNELKSIYSNKSALNATLQKYGTALKGRYHWTSTEYVDYKPEFCAWGVVMGDGDTYYHGKNLDNYVRAVSAF